MKITKKNSKLDRVSWTQCAVNGLKKNDPNGKGFQKSPRIKKFPKRSLQNFNKIGEKSCLPTSKIQFLEKRV